MPCRDDPPPSLTEKYLQAEVVELRALLCEACQVLEHNGELGSGSLGPLKQWYETHNRGEADRVRRETLQTLTLKQTQALGLVIADSERHLLKKGP